MARPTANPIVHIRLTSVVQSGSGLELKEALRFQVRPWAPLGQTPRAEHRGGTHFLRRVAVRKLANCAAIISSV